MANMPTWFKEWKDNEYRHLVNNVSNIKRDVGWLKWLVGFVLAALIIAAIAILIGG